MIEVIRIMQDLFVNACILVSIIFIISQFLKNVDIKDLKIKFRMTFLLGVFGGILGIALMFYRVHITSFLILDFQHISEVVIAIYGGIFSVAITGIISITFLLFSSGITTYSVVTSLGILIVSIGCGIISKLIIGNKEKWIYMVIYSVIVRSIILYSLLRNVFLFQLVVLLLLGGTLVVGSLVYYLVQYLDISNKVLKNLQHDATKDFLTGLNNVRNFNKLLNEIMKNIWKRNESLSVLVVDIDLFKKINDTYGHSAGDCVLKSLAQILRGACNKFDIVGRIGGDEFSIILARCSNIKAIEIAERIRAVVEKYPFVLPEGKTVYITVSIGVATYPDTTLQYNDIVRCADMALYKAKQTGRNKVSSLINKKLGHQRFR